MRELALLCITATVLVAVMAEESKEHLIKKMKDNHHKMDKITAGIVNLQDELHHRKTENEHAIADSHNMWHRLDKKHGGDCRKHQFSCDVPHECVDICMCCDGEKDCDNGDDESHDLCHPHIDKGDHWEGRFIYYTCNQEILTDVTFKVTKFHKKDYLKGFADVEGILHWTDETNPAHHLSEQLPYHGIYTYCTRNADFRVEYHGETYHEHLYFYKGEADVLYYDIHHASTGDECGKAIMSRRHDDHYEEHHHV